MNHRAGDAPHRTRRVPAVWWNPRATLGGKHPSFASCFHDEQPPGQREELPTRGAVLHAFNEPPRFEQFSEPIAEENEVIVHVRAAALKPVDKQMASGSHCAAFRELPVVCGMDGVGCLDDGTRVFFARPRSPYGSMAQRTIVSPSHSFPIPDNIHDDIAAAVVNPGLSAWGALAWRAQLTVGETVLILVATGVTGKLAVQTAKLLGAGRVIAAGRNEQVLNTLHDLGADTTTCLDTPC